MKNHEWRIKINQEKFIELTTLTERSQASEKIKIIIYKIMIQLKCSVIKKAEGKGVKKKESTKYILIRIYCLN